MKIEFTEYRFREVVDRRILYGLRSDGWYVLSVNGVFDLNKIIEGNPLIGDLDECKTGIIRVNRMEAMIILFSGDRHEYPR